MSGPERPKSPWGRTNGGGFFDLHPPPPPNRCPQTEGPRASIAVLQRPRHRPHCLQAPPQRFQPEVPKTKKRAIAFARRRGEVAPPPSPLNGSLSARRRGPGAAAVPLWALYAPPPPPPYPPPNHAEPHRDDDDENLLKQCLHLLNNVPQTMLALLNDIRICIYKHNALQYCLHLKTSDARMAGLVHKNSPTVTPYLHRRNARTYALRPTTRSPRSRVGAKRLPPPRGVIGFVACVPKALDVVCTLRALDV